VTELGARASVTLPNEVEGQTLLGRAPSPYHWNWPGVIEVAPEAEP